MQQQLVVKHNNQIATHRSPYTQKQAKQQFQLDFQKIKLKTNLKQSKPNASGNNDYIMNEPNVDHDDFSVTVGAQKLFPKNAAASSLNTGSWIPKQQNANFQFAST